MSEAQKRDVISEIAAERERQVSVEGWTPEHDDKHSDGCMARAAACYAFNAGVWLEQGRDMNKHNYFNFFIPGYRWPWDREWWKPKNPRRDLIRATALIVAEIERLDRAEIVKEPK